jgi:hypothetical protein
MTDGGHQRAHQSTRSRGDIDGRSPGRLPDQHGIRGHRSAGAAAAARKAAYEARLKANQAAPVTAEEARTYAETALFTARASHQGLSDGQINSLLTSGDWVGFPTETTIVRAGQDENPETVPEAAAAEVAASAPDQAETDAAEIETPDDGSSGAVTAQAAHCYGGNGPTITVKAKNVTGSTLWYYQVGEQYCYNGRSVTSYDKQPYVNHKVYNWAQALGWSWEGQDLSGAKGPARYRWHGNSKGGLKTWRKGTMKYDPTHLEIGSFQKFPYVHLYEHADGSYKYSYGM